MRATVGASNSAAGESCWPNASSTRAASRVARIESPPRSRNASWIPTRSRSSTSAQILASRASTGVRGPSNGLPVSGRRAARRWQRLSVDLSRGAAWQRLEHHERRRDHVARQRRLQGAPELRAGQRRRDRRDHVGDQAVLPGGLLSRHDRRLAHHVEREQGALDLRQLDPVSPDLDLEVLPAEEQETIAVHHAAEVARAIDALGAASGIGQEPRPRSAPGRASSQGSCSATSPRSPRPRRVPRTGRARRGAEPRPPPPRGPPAPGRLRSPCPCR